MVASWWELYTSKYVYAGTCWRATSCSSWLGRYSNTYGVSTIPIAGFHKPYHISIYFHQTRFTEFAGNNIGAHTNKAQIPVDTSPKSRSSNPPFNGKFCRIIRPSKTVGAECTIRGAKQPVPYPYRIHAWYIYLHEWLIFLVNVGKYTIHGSYGLGFKQHNLWKMLEKCCHVELPGFIAWDSRFLDSRHLYLM